MALPWFAFDVSAYLKNTMRLSTDDDNLTTSCLPCNREKAGRTVDQWRAAS